MSDAPTPTPTKPRPTARRRTPTPTSPPEDATSTYVPAAARDWARRWPLEHVWWAGKS